MLIVDQYPEKIREIEASYPDAESRRATSTSPGETRTHSPISHSLKLGCAQSVEMGAATILSSNWRS